MGKNKFHHEGHEDHEERIFPNRFTFQILFLRELRVLRGES